MDQNNPKSVTVRNEIIVNAAPATCFIYSVLCFGFAAGLLGWVGEGFGLAIGVLQLSVYVGYTIGAIFILKTGSGIGGNTFFIFATLFGGTGGSIAIAGAVFQHLGIPFATQMGNVVNIVCGVFLWVLLFVNRVSVKTDFFTILFAAIGVSAAGLQGFVAPDLMGQIAGWALFIDGIVVFYAAAIGMLAMSGCKVNYGKPFVEMKEE